MSIHNIEEKKVVDETESNTDGKKYGTVGFTFAREHVRIADVDKCRLPQVDTDDLSCMMKIAILTNHIGTIYYNYFVKVNPRGSLFDPWDAVGEGFVRDGFDKQKGKEKCPFMKVPESIFKDYATYLKTRNKAWLSKADRQMRSQ